MTDAVRLLRVALTSDVQKHSTVGILIYSTKLKVKTAPVIYPEELQDVLNVMNSTHIYTTKTSESNSLCHSDVEVSILRYHYRIQKDTHSSG